jgi:hypothetical protein
MRIDVLIIKKTRDITIKKSLGQIFRNHNIIEYKNPNDSFSINDFGKTMAYCYTYTSNKKVPITDISLSIIVSKKPLTVFKHLKAVYGWKINEEYPGIHIVSGAGLAFPIQLIDSKKLPETENLYLKNLREGVPFESVEKVFTESKDLKGADWEGFAAYIYVLSNANSENMKELIKMRKPAFDRVIEETGLAAKWEQRGRELGEQHGEQRGRELERQQWQAERQRLQEQNQQLQRQLQQVQTRTGNQ